MSYKTHFEILTNCIFRGELKMKEMRKQIFVKKIIHFDIFLQRNITKNIDCLGFTVLPT